MGGKGSLSRDVLLKYRLDTITQIPLPPPGCALCPFTEEKNQIILYGSRFKPAVLK